MIRKTLAASGAALLVSMMAAAMAAMAAVFRLPPSQPRAEGKPATNGLSFHSKFLRQPGRAGQAEVSLPLIQSNKVLRLPLRA